MVLGFISAIISFKNFQHSYYNNYTPSLYFFLKKNNLNPSHVIKYLSLRFKYLNKNLIFFKTNSKNKQFTSNSLRSKNYELSYFYNPSFFQNEVSFHSNRIQLVGTCTPSNNYGFLFRPETDLSIFNLFNASEKKNNFHGFEFIQQESIQKNKLPARTKKRAGQSISNPLFYNNNLHLRRRYIITSLSKNKQLHKSSTLAFYKNPQLLRIKSRKQLRIFKTKARLIKLKRRLYSTIISSNVVYSKIPNLQTNSALSYKKPVSKPRKTPFIDFSKKSHLLTYFNFTRLKYNYYTKFSFISIIPALTRTSIYLTSSQNKPSWENTSKHFYIKLNSFFKRDFNKYKYQKYSKFIKVLRYKSEKKKHFSKKYNSHAQKQSTFQYYKQRLYTYYIYNKLNLNWIPTVNIITDDKIKLPKKWKHSQPYFFTNTLDKDTSISPPILDSYLNSDFQTIEFLTKENNYFKSPKLNNLIRKINPSFFREKTKPHLTIKTFPKIYWKNYQEKKNLPDILTINSVRPDSKFRIKKPLDRTYFQPQKKTKTLQPILTGFGKSRLKVIKYNNFKKRKSLLRPKIYNTFLSIYSRLLPPKLIRFYFFRTWNYNAFNNNTFFKFDFQSLCQVNKLSLCKILPSKVDNKPHITQSGNRHLSSLDLFSRTEQPFILKLPIVFFSKFFLTNFKQKCLVKYVFKKKIFSFLKPNEVRQSLMNRKKQYFFYNLIFNQKLLIPKSLYFSPSKLKQLFNETSKCKLLNTYSWLNYPLSINSQVYNLNHEKNDILNTEVFNLRGVNQLFQRSEIKIPRVRFKPGYQRLWRQSRLALKEALQLKFTYQKKLTKYVTKFFKTTHRYAFSGSEMAMDKVIVYSRLLPDLTTLAIFLKQRLIYLNGTYTDSLNMSVYENDILQLLISKWYYSAYKWISNWTLRRVKKFNRLIYRKGLAGKYKLMKQRKQKSFHTPKWVYLTRYDISDIKPYLEVDYLTLSAVIIYNPYILEYYTPAETPDYRPNIYRLYNWKYIT